MSKKFFNLSEVISVIEEGGKPPCLLCAILDEENFEVAKIIDIDTLNPIASIPVEIEQTEGIQLQGIIINPSNIKIDIDILLSTIYTNPESVSVTILPEVTSKMIHGMVNMNMLRKPEIYNLKEEFDELFKNYIPGQEREILIPIRNRIGNLCTKYGF